MPGMVKMNASACTSAAPEPTEVRFVAVGQTDHPPGGAYGTGGGAGEGGGAGYEATSVQR